MIETSSGQAVMTRDAVPIAAAETSVAAKAARLPLIDALRAFAASMISWHHLTLYPPLADGAMPLAGDAIVWIRDHARVAQVFFVISGYILARTLSKRDWNGACVRRYVIFRYCRLGLPYLAAIAVALAACFYGRGWIDESVIGAPPTAPQLLAHVVFLQDILGYESLSAGLWFVCINFQLTMVFVAGLYLRDALAGPQGATVRSWRALLPAALGWTLAATSLFYFNLDGAWDVWAVYFFGQFFLGVLVYAALESPRWNGALVLYVLLIVAAAIFQWRVRLLTTLLTGAILYAGGKWGDRLPGNRVVEFLGRTSYSLFLLHFPVLVFVAALWMRNGWTSPAACLAGLVITYFASVSVSAPFHRFVEEPAARLSRRFS